MAQPTMPAALATATVPEIEKVLPDESNGWSISRPLGRLLAGLVIQQRLSSILEFGAGQSSVVLARALSIAGGGRLTSVDHQDEYCRDAWRHVESTPGVDSQLLIAPIRRQLTTTGLLYSYAGISPHVGRRGPYDLVFIDAPPRIFGREAPLHSAYRHLREGAFIVVDDAARPEETTTVRRWLRRYPGLSVVVLDREFPRGLAVLRHTGGTATRFSARSVLGTFHDEFRRWRDPANPSRRGNGRPC